MTLRPLLSRALASTTLALAMLCLSSAAPAAAEHHESGNAEDRAAVERAILDYVEGFYEMAPEKIERGVSPDLAKRGFVGGKDGYRELTMNFEQAKALAARYNASGDRVGDNPKKDVVLFEVLDRTASAKLTADWGIDYLHLKKDADGRWRIANVIWQTLPEGYGEE